jgi:cupin 2 domain-containing protein
VTIAGNLLADVPTALAEEELRVLLATPGLRIARIVSTGQASPPGFWYDQDQAEFVLVVAGRAGLLIEGEAAARELEPGSYVHMPAHCRHRVEWTDSVTPTVWLAVHVDASV